MSDRENESAIINALLSPKNTMNKDNRLLYEKLYDTFGPTDFAKIKVILDEAKAEFPLTELYITKDIVETRKWFKKYFGLLDNPVEGEQKKP